MEMTCAGLVAILAGCEITSPVPSLNTPMSPITTIDPTSRKATRSCSFANISTPFRLAIITTAIMIAVYTILGIGSGITCDIAYAKMDASTPVDKILQIRYPPTMDTIVGSGPMQANVYCASPPVMFGISAFSSDNDPMVVRFKRHATTIAPINTIPTSPAP